MNDQNAQIKKMLEALLKANDQIHWVGAYAHGLTQTGDPFIVLFPASEKLNFQVCRVYPESFGKLPEFVDTRTPAHVHPSKRAPEKTDAVKCRSFCVLTYPGKDTQMGPETRFHDVLRLGKEVTQNGTPPHPPAPLATPARTLPPPSWPLTFFCDDCGDYPVAEAGDLCPACTANAAALATPPAVELTDPHPPRPWTPVYLKAYMVKRAEELNGWTITIPQRNAIAVNIESCFATEDAPEKRRAVLAYLWGKNIPDLTDSQAAATSKWLNAKKDTGGEYKTDPRACKEIQAVYEATLAAVKP